MSKRRPDFQLTKDNFDHEQDQDEVECLNEPPPAASLNVLKERVVLKAKRRMPSEQSGGDPSGTFSGFKGFASTFGSGNSASNNSFSKFGNFGASNASPSTFGSSSSATLKNPLNFGGTYTPTVATTTIEKNDDNGKNSLFGTKIESSSNSVIINKVTDDNNNNEDNGTFAANLNQLNNMFFNHIKKYMDISALYDFTTVCEQYVNHYKKIKQEKSQSPSNKPNCLETKLNNISSESSSKFTFGENNKKTEPSPQQPSSAFKIPNFSANLTSAAAATTTTMPSNNSSMFSFGSNPSNNGLFPSSFAVPASTNSSSLFPTTQFNAPKIEEPEQQQGDDDEPPPKVVSVEHTEENSVYSKKCKLYYQKDGSFVEKGVSFLYIKVNGEESKEKPAQLLIRADTSTGNILLNIALVESLPVLKADKGKGVLLTCIPNPPIDSKSDDQKSVTFLIRVKQTECDQLYDKLMKYKSSNSDKD